MAQDSPDLCARELLTHRKTFWVIHSSCPNLMYVWLNKTLHRNGLWIGLPLCISIGKQNGMWLLKPWPVSSVFLSMIPGMGLKSAGLSSPENTQTCSDTFSSGKGISSNAYELSFVVYLHSEWMGTDALCSQWKKGLSWSERGPTLPHWDCNDRQMNRNCPGIFC